MGSVTPAGGSGQLSLRLLLEAGEPGDAPVLGELEEVDPCEGQQRNLFGRATEESTATA
jgi:hypothetical protein